MAIDLKTLNHDASDNGELKNLLEENLKLAQQTHDMVRSIKHHIVLEQVFNIIKILIIVVPIILGIIYLPSILKPYLDQYNQIMEGAGVITPDINETLKQISPETINNILKKK